MKRLINELKSANEAYILDFEFNGVPRDGEYSNIDFNAQITQVKWLKIKRINGQWIRVADHCRNFGVFGRKCRARHSDAIPTDKYKKSTKKYQYGALIKGGLLSSDERFDRSELEEIIQSGLPVFGWGISTDKKLLEKYDIILRDYYDIQAMLKCHKVMSKKITNLASFNLEQSWMAVRNKVNLPNGLTHSDVSEVYLIFDILKYIDSERVSQFSDLPIYCPFQRFLGLTWNEMAKTDGGHKSLYGILYRGNGYDDPWDNLAAKAAYRSAEYGY